MENYVILIVYNIHMNKKIIYIVIEALLVLTWSHINATIINPKQLNIRQETLSSKKINEDLDGFLIAYFSDVNYGKFYDSVQLNKLVETINDYYPDVVLFSGDLLDEIETPMSKENREQLEIELKSIKAKYGKYAVLGDEDELSKDKVVNLLESAGFIVLNNEIKTITVNQNASIQIAGLENIKNSTPDVSILSNLNDAYYTIAMSHTPDLFNDVRNYNVDYMLAGHSRGGQIYVPIINLLYRDVGCRYYYHGKTTRNNTTLDITNGLGQNKYNARLFADPELVLYKLDAK